MKRAFAWGLALWAGSGIAAARAQDRPPVIYTPVVLSGDPVPGPLGGTFAGFPYHSVINDANLIALLGSRSSPFAPDGLFLAGDGPLELVAYAGQDAPGFAPGVTISSFDVNYYRANNNAQVVFESTLAGPGIAGTGDDNTNAWANWFWSAGQLQPIAQWQAPAPGTDAMFRTFERITINDLGHVAFAGDLTGGSVTDDDNTAFWYGPPDQLQLLAREGSPAPGGLTYGEMSGFDYPYLARGGNLVFITQLSGFAQRALFAGTADNLELVAKTGDVLPGTTLHYGIIQGHGTPPRINDNGQSLFVSFLDDGSRALLTGTPDAITMVAQTGQPAPGLPDLEIDFLYDYGINDAGQVAFRAQTKASGSSDYGEAIYAGPPDQLELVAAIGHRAPDAEDGVVFWSLTDPVINQDGQVAFFGYLAGPAARGADDYGLFATGHGGRLRLVARYGDEFEVAPGDVRTIAALSHAGVYGTHVVTFNAQSDLSLLIRFTDGSEGIFTARVLPEPCAAPLLSVLGAVAAVGHRRRLRHGTRCGGSKRG